MFREEFERLEQSRLAAVQLERTERRKRRAAAKEVRLWPWCRLAPIRDCERVSHSRSCMPVCVVEGGKEDGEAAVTRIRTVLLLR